MILRRILNINNLYIIFMMIILQIFWLVGIWITGASTNTQLLLYLGIYSIVSGGLVLLTVKHMSQFNDPIVEAISDRQNGILPVILIVVAVIGVIYAIIQRVWPWDEEFAFTAAMLIAKQGVGTFMDYYADLLWVHNHPPLIFLLNGLILRITGDYLLVIRLISLAFAIGTVLLTYLIGSILEDRISGILAAIFIVTFPLFFRLGTAAVLDIQVTFFFALAMYIFILFLRNPGFLLAIALALTMSAGLLTKYTMVFILPILAIVCVSSRKYWRLIPYLALIGVIVAAIFVGWLYIGEQAGLSVPGLSLFDLLRRSGSTVVENMEPPSEDIAPGKVERIDFAWYLTSSEGRMNLVSNIGTRLSSAIGPYNIPLIILGSLLILKRRSEADWILTIWMLVITCILLLTIPDHRYFMPIFPAVAITIALWLKHHQRHTSQVTILSILYLAAALILFADWYRAADLFQ